MNMPELPAAGEPYANEPSKRVSEPQVPHMWMPVKRSRMLLAACLFGVAVFISGIVFDLLLMTQERFHPATAAAVLDAFLAVLAAALLYQVLSYDREKRSRVLQRLETIDEMNHHIRNALQVIAFNAHSSSTEFELAEIKQAVNRIQWALREILPKVEPEFTPFEGSARESETKDADKKSAGEF